MKRNKKYPKNFNTRLQDVAMACTLCEILEHTLKIKGNSWSFLRILNEVDMATYDIENNLILFPDNGITTYNTHLPIH